MEYEAKLGQMRALKEQKEALFTQLRSELSKLGSMRGTLAKLRAQARSSSNVPTPEEITKQIDEIEFQIATTAFTPARERELIKESERERKLLAESKEVYSGFAAFKAKRKEFEQTDLIVRGIDSKLAALRAQMNSLHSEIVAAGEANRKERSEKAYHSAAREYKEKTRKEYAHEAEPFMDKGEIEVSLLDAAVMSKEDRKKLHDSETEGKKQEPAPSQSASE